MMIPALPAALWVAAAAALVLLLLIFFGFHVYQRARLRALAEESSNVGVLAARKEQLEADISARREWLGEARSELLKLEAERHTQELLRSDIEQLEKRLLEKKRENANSLKYASEMDLLIARKRNLLSRLEAEIKTLEERRKSLEATRQEALGLEQNIEAGRLRLASMADQEIRFASLRRQADNLADERDGLIKELAPLREEKQRLHQFIVKARQAAAVRNERILEQGSQLHKLEIAESDLQENIRRLTAANEELEKTRAEQAARASAQEENLNSRLQEAEAAQTKAQLEAEELNQEVERRKEEARKLREQKEELRFDIARLEARRASIEPEPVMAREERKKRKPVGRVRGESKRRLTGKLPARPQQIFAGYMEKGDLHE